MKKRRGKITISDYVFEQIIDEGNNYLMSLFTMISFIEKKFDTYTFYGYSKHFDEVEELQCPEYVPTFKKLSDGSIILVDIEKQ